MYQTVAATGHPPRASFDAAAAGLGLGGGWPGVTEAQLTKLKREFQGTSRLLRAPSKRREALSRAWVGAKNKAAPVPAPGPTAPAPATAARRAIAAQPSQLPLLYRLLPGVARAAYHTLRHFLPPELSCAVLEWLSTDGWPGAACGGRAPLRRLRDASASTTAHQQHQRCVHRAAPLRAAPRALVFNGVVF